jgi:hypothetical protein
MRRKQSHCLAIYVKETIHETFLPNLVLIYWKKSEKMETYFFLQELGILSEWLEALKIK